MKFSKSTTLAAATTLLLAAVDAHMILAKPAPFKFEPNIGAINGPMDPSGSDFPCKAPAGLYEAEASNVIPVGVPQPLTFTGSAVHGGGSCQVSITKDLKPTKDSEWKVIHSIEGACPIAAEGNLPENANLPVDSGLNFTVPEGLKDGPATLAWTWFNRIGNREMYMNCAPIEITGGKGDETFFDSLPNMFVSNLGSLANTECTKTPEMFDLSFPEPGQSVVRSGDKLQTCDGKKVSAAEGSGATASNSGSGASGSGGSGSGGSGSGVSGSGASGSGASGSGASSGSASVAPPATVPTNSGAVFAEGANSATTSSAPSSTATAPLAAAADPSNGTTSGSAATNGGSSGSPSSGGASTGTCSAADAGKMVCNGESMFGTCDQLGQVVWRNVADGTVCRDGTIAAAAVKRHVRFSKNHIRRGHRFI